MRRLSLRATPIRSAITFAVAAWLSGCAGSTAPDQGIAVDETTVTVTAPSENGVDDAPNSLADYLGNARGGARPGGAAALAGGDDEVIEEQRRIQQAIQVCMQAQGFDYAPEQIGDALQFFLATRDRGVDPADFAATEGFGISTRFDELLDGDVELEESANLNDAYVATLSEGEADAWNLALSGAPPERNASGQLIDPETGEVTQRNARGAAGGCQLEARTEVRGEAVVLGELEDELALLDDRIASDPRVTEIGRQWLDCMSVEGFDYADENEARADVRSQLQPLLRSFFTSANSDAGADGGGVAPGRQAGGGNRLQAIAGLQLSPEQDAELEALQDLERAIAVASFACQGDTAGELADITARYEAEFIEVNRAALEALSS